ncbi:MAG: UDP-N-acetylmuramoyl-L-alanine--D-glutamate ligase [Firmicutes bacterium]|nr:UDP-N-acetylmuramoyl-L-alanine--D-glutamate ligase [Bacillota bacterium]
MDLNNKKVIVLGAGKSGLSTVRFLLKRGAKVALYDGNAAEKPVYDELRYNNVALYLGEVPEKADFDFAVVSPGIPPQKDPCYRFLADNGVHILGELELASRFITAPIVGITGTNGKTTTTTLVGEMLKNGGFKTFVGGNIGVPLMEGIEDDYDFYVVEMSSFQLETVETMDAFVSVYLNLTPDHLDRHGDMKHYLEAKAKMALHQSAKHYTILNSDDLSIKSLEMVGEGRKVYFARENHTYYGMNAFDDGRIRFFDPHSDIRQTSFGNASEIGIPGPHNLENAMAAASAAFLCGVDEETIRETLRNFKGVEHRLEYVRTIDGVRYVNDSKATNPDSVFKALASFGESPIVLIAGGRNKGNSFDDLAVDICAKCRSLILIGEAAEDMKASALKQDMVGIYMVEDMEAAVKKAKDVAQAGDVVLLSPANASFDQFESYEHRGRVFKDIVKGL